MTDPISRRHFVRNAIFLGTASAAAFATEPLPVADAFDALPKDVWARARTNGLIMIRRPEPAQKSSRADIVSKDEPGQRLIVAGQVFAPDDGTVAGVTVYAYNTDAQGYYGANHTEYPPRLYGWMKTDAQGRFELHTILPGHYPNMHIPAHVHFTAWGAGYPPQWIEELRFAGDPYLTPDMSAAAGQGEFRSVQPLIHGADGVLRCTYKFRLQRETNFR